MLLLVLLHLLLVLLVLLLRLLSRRAAGIRRRCCCCRLWRLNRRSALLAHRCCLAFRLCRKAGSATCHVQALMVQQAPQLRSWCGGCLPGIASECKA